MLRGKLVNAVAEALNKRQAFDQRGSSPTKWTSAINTLALRDEDLEEESRARVTRHLWTIVLAGAGLASVV